jgi:hypothetical protein
MNSQLPATAYSLLSYPYSIALLIPVITPFNNIAAPQPVYPVLPLPIA